MSYILEPYDEGLRQILNTGRTKKNRTGMDALSVFSIESRYNISDRFPLLTGRKVWPKAIFAELLWILSGSTNVKDLEKLGSNIWSKWRSEEFERKHGYIEGALGPIYGFQLRYFGGQYGTGSQNEWNEYGYGGFDQLTHMVDTLKSEPNSRRILIDLWNPADAQVSVLAPCHYSLQVDLTEGILSAKLVQRSGDYPIGIPANIQFYSALIYMLAQQVGAKPGEFVHSVTDAHIYKNQVEAVEEYLARPKPASPRLTTTARPSILEYVLDDFQVIDYQPLAPIKIPVEV